MPETTYVVQFPHPGLERLPHQPARGKTLPWNTGEHGRKYLRSKATYFDGHDWRSGEVAFWGEWEPQSTIVEMLPRGFKLPRAVQDPHWRVPAELPRRQNTDPLVFGEHFSYTNCRQTENSRLLSLTPGSVVLFGSKVASRFVLDTVVVVAARMSFRPPDGIQGPGYLDPLVADPLSRSERWGNFEFQFYRGATPELPINGMYSFAPCIPYEPGGRGFARPALDLGDLLNHNLAMAARTIPLEPSRTAAVWQQVVDQVLHAGLALGTAFPLPPTPAGSEELEITRRS